MKHKLLLLLFFLALQTFSANSQELYNREFRGVWIATVGNMDWPSPGATAESQKTALRTQLDKIKEANLNVVFFQVRPEADALYRSTKEPWSRFLTGKQGQDPGYDPLAFAIEEAHKRGLELHAWFNPYRVNYSTSSTIEYDPMHVIHSKPDWLLDVNGKKILNPGLPAVRDYVTSVVMEVVNNYNVDGVHFDDYFYQYPPDQITNQDASTYQQYGGGMTLANWRRNNVNQLMKQINDAINGSKPEVRFGISPFGLWKNGVPSGTSGMDAYNVIYADPVNWLENRYVDYLTPQLYWRIGGGQDFRKLIDWWSTQAFQNDRHLYSGHILNSTFSNEELPNQILITREQQYRSKNSLGSVFFRSSLLANNELNLFENLKNNLYRYPAVPPLMEWKPGEAPAAPSNITSSKNEQAGQYVITWTRNPANTHEFKRYVVYALNSATAPTSVDALPEGSVRAIVATEEAALPAFDLPSGNNYFVVAELSPTNRLSGLSDVVTINKTEVGPSAPIVTAPATQQTSTSESSIRFRWITNEVVQGYHYQWSTSPTFATVVDENSSMSSATLSRLFFNLNPGLTYYFRIRSRNSFSWSDWSSVYSVNVWPTGISDLVQEDQIKVYPNPTSGPINIDLHLKKAATVRAELFSMDGQNKLKTVSKKFGQGDQTIRMSRGRLSAGVYVLKLVINGELSVHRVVLL
ncbi:family 10 glycosylhydrolase [Rufibacter roseus]|uniref:Family 10 glycosylhydrolase n=1 Tax=Rufibacter roseus TaxID=1567108 RepID=A0ABW2DNK7_9BACT|nr:family 10 glycosylhydrolase [Rufibacter roseus]